MMKKTGKLISLLLTVCMIAGMLPATTFAAGTESVTNESDSYSYDITTHTLTVTGENGLFDFPEANRSEVVHLVIEAESATIPMGCFYQSTSLKTVRATGGNVIVGTSAFSECTSLESVQLTTDRCTIGTYAFWVCSALKVVEIPGTSMIGNSAFYQCSNLQTIVCSGTGSRTIGANVFVDVPEDVSVLVPEDFTDDKFGEFGVAKYSLAEDGILTIISVPKGCTTLYYPSIIGNVEINTVTIPEDVSAIVVEVSQITGNPEPEITWWDYMETPAFTDDNEIELLSDEPPTEEKVKAFLPESISAEVDGEQQTVSLTWNSEDSYPDTPDYQVFGKSYTYTAAALGYRFSESASAPTITVKIKVEHEEYFRAGATREVEINGGISKEDLMAYLPKMIANLDSSESADPYIPVDWDFSQGTESLSQNDTIHVSGTYVFRAKNNLQIEYKLMVKQTMITLGLPKENIEIEGNNLFWTDTNTSNKYQIFIDGFEGTHKQGNTQHYIFVDENSAQPVTCVSEGDDQGEHVYRINLTIKGENAENAEPLLENDAGYRTVEDYEAKDQAMVISSESYLIDAKPDEATFALMLTIGTHGARFLNFKDNGFQFYNTSSDDMKLDFKGEVSDGRTYQMKFIDSGDDGKFANNGKKFFSVTPPDGEERAYAVLLIPTERINQSGGSADEEQELDPNVSIDTAWDRTALVNFDNGWRYFEESLFKNSDGHFAATYLTRNVTAMVLELALDPNENNPESAFQNAENVTLSVDAGFNFKSSTAKAWYQWYRCDDANGTNAVTIEGATTESYMPPTNEAGTYYYYVKAGFKPFEEVNGYEDANGNLLQDYDPYGWASDRITTSEVVKFDVVTPTQDTIKITAPTFAEAHIGYKQPEAKSLKISSEGAGNVAAKISNITVDNENFIGVKGSDEVPVGGSNESWKIRPASGLQPATYTATVTVTYDNDKTATTNVSFVVTDHRGGSSSCQSRATCFVCGEKYGPYGNHSYGDWKSDAENHWKACFCGTSTAKAEHSIGEWVITKEATKAEDGSRERSCSVCEYKETEVIPALGYEPEDPDHPDRPGKIEILKAFTHKKGVRVIGTCINADGYEFSIRKGGDGQKYGKIYDVKECKYTFKELKENTRYVIRIRPYHLTNGVRIYGEKYFLVGRVLVKKADFTERPTVAKVTNAFTHKKGIRVDVKSSGAHGYEFYIRKGGENQEYTLVQDSKKAYCKMLELTEGQRYVIRIKPYVIVDEEKVYAVENTYVTGRAEKAKKSLM